MTKSGSDIIAEIERVRAAHKGRNMTGAEPCNGITPTTTVPATEAGESSIELRETISQLEQEYQHSGLENVTTDPEDRIATWVMGKLNELDTTADMVRQQAERMLAALEHRKKAVLWKWGLNLKAAVDRRLALQKHSKKSVDFLTGRAGYRTTPEKMQIVDGSKLLEWCAFNCPEALGTEIKRTTPVKQYIKTTGDIPPGVRWIDKHETFYPAINKPELAPAYDSEQKGH
jgi:hypothetical protein